MFSSIGGLSGNPEDSYFFVLPGMSEVEVRCFQVHGLEELRLKFFFEDAGTDAPAAPHLSHNRARFKLNPIPHPANF